MTEREKTTMDHETKLKQALQDQMQDEYQSFLSKREELDFNTSASYNRKMKQLSQKMSGGKKNSLLRFKAFLGHYALPIAALLVLVVGLAAWRSGALRVKMDMNQSSDNSITNQPQGGAALEEVLNDKEKEELSKAAEMLPEEIPPQGDNEDGQKTPGEKEPAYTQAVTMPIVADPTIQNGSQVKVEPLLDQRKELRDIHMRSLPEGYDFYAEGDTAEDIKKAIAGLQLCADFEENPDEYGGMTWVIDVEYADGETVTIYDFGNLFIRCEAGPWYKMEYEEAKRLEELLFRGQE